ncbi:hypothetical protein GH714_029952 [Hevea brasiliensis]|uniref:RNase H type-1 domain-containing protein n=1 Tax=Hevea brasiliensis TaxID=3981 RepID=A0A6A6KBA3_HEVBR|nr:hypothetical protein GH714_029952 [Hevea brasiliensis]
MPCSLVLRRSNIDRLAHSMAFRAHVKDFQNASFSIKPVPIVTLVQRWKALLNRLFKLNKYVVIVDGLYCGLGMVVRDHNGNVQMLSCYKLPYPLSVDEAEATIAYFGICRAKEAGLFKLILESDVLFFVNSAQNRVVLPSYFGSKLQTVLYEAQSLDVFQCVHLVRYVNVVAHSLTKFALSSIVNELIFMEELHPFTADLLFLAL